MSNETVTGHSTRILKASLLLVTILLGGVSFALVKQARAHVELLEKVHAGGGALAGIYQVSSVIAGMKGIRGGGGAIEGMDSETFGAIMAPSSGLLNPLFSPWGEGGISVRGHIDNSFDVVVAAVPRHICVDLALAFLDSGPVYINGVSLSHTGNRIQRSEAVYDACDDDAATVALIGW